MIERGAAYAWRLIVITIAGIALLWLVGQLWVMFLALFIALLLVRVLASFVAAARVRGVPSGLAAAGVLFAFLAAVAGVVALISTAVVSEVDRIEPTISQAIDDLESWLVEDSPFDVSRADVDRFRDDVGETVGSSLRSSDGALVSGALLAFEVAVAIVLALIITFFGLKDGDRFLRFVRDLVPAARGERAARLAARAWRTIGGYLRGAATLGVVEGIILGVTLAVVGAELAVPVGVLTFIAAFVPFVGAIVAGAVAVLVALATAGGPEAVIVLVVAVLVQQLDNELLAPIVYGRALEIHPVVVLLAITAGGALFGVPGSVLAVPITAVAWNVIGEARDEAGRATPIS